MKKYGRFIVVEGLDGVGKTTIVNKIVEELRSEGKEVVQTREPGGTPNAEKIRNFILTSDTDLGPLLETQLIQAARRDHLDKVIEPALQDGKYVVCDRWQLSTRIYQHGISTSLLGAEDIHSKIYANMVGPVKPDVTVVLFATREVRNSRLKARYAADSTKPDYFEARDDSFMDGMEKTLEYYTKRADEAGSTDNVYIDANVDADGVFYNVLKQWDKIVG